jgi:hypothetical protein
MALEQIGRGAYLIQRARLEGFTGTPMSAQAMNMRMIKETLRYKLALGHSLERTAMALKISKGVVAKYVALAEGAGLQWADIEAMTRSCKKMASRNIAGDDLSAAVERLQLLQTQGFCATIDVLGETASTPAQAHNTAADYLRVTCPQFPYQLKFQKSKVCKIN